MNLEQRVGEWIDSGKVRKTVWEFSCKHQWITAGVLALGVLLAGEVSLRIYDAFRDPMEKYPACLTNPIQEKRCVFLSKDNWPLKPVEVPKPRIYPFPR